ncbi:GH18 family chitinase [Arcticibacter tournemirensis]|uniref:chitinase n=1 Tax=Arcticibacter tournemirensis TaxID=699437 RepID=A0A5M9GUY4_9SPHI|nr:glycosyl hydrolase family 18 protein [Arcticibacter tournemirensis]KAA8476594.1 hypothetical protein F1649_19925 [Arcticibacter tournemirensis]TQM52500.1 GH18 family chitinase [Arcticibacter tournemirensis]
MRVVRLIIQIICFLPVFTACSKSGTDSPAKGTEKKAYEKGFHIVGYMFSSGNMDTESAKLDFSRITHLNIAFLNPDENGVFAAVPGLAAAAKRAHEHHVKILFSFGGGSAPAHLKDLIKEDKRAKFINELVRVTTTYDLDGVDVDLEGEFIDANYEAFVTGLSAALKLQNKLMTVAVATWNGNSISDKALALFDIINVMSYDQTGPWNKDRPGPHSTYDAAVNDLNYWMTTRSVPAGKLTLGLPFYGYGFGPSIEESFSYGDIVKRFPGSELTDFVEVAGQGTIYYNGIPTIRKKVELALSKKAGGVMIWQLFGDAAGDKSLLKAINSAIPE